MKKLLFSNVLLAFLIGFIACNNPKPATEATAKEEAVEAKPDPAEVLKTAMQSADAENLRTAMRKLWEDHVTWTRNVILCLVDNVPGADQAVKRLMQNQDDIGNAVKSYYGDDAGKKLTDLLHDHIAISADVVKSAKKNDTKALDAASKKWSDNADQISGFLSGANPNWKLDDMKMMMHDHLKLTTDEAVARIKKDYDGDIKAYDNVHDEILKMADMLSDGIIKQFPDKFK
jgi:hypothetical protein